MRLDWNQPPGGVRPPRSFRAQARKILASLLVGVVSVGVAWAGAGLVPMNGLATDQLETPGAPRPQARDAQGGLVEGTSGGFDIAAVEAGQIMAGAVKVSIKPRPGDYGGIWEQDRDKCVTLPPNEQSFPEMATHVADFRVRWAENSNCIYMGGYGIGPMNPITSWDDEYGLWARSIAMSDGTDTVVLTLLDAVYWEGRYNSMCDACGFLDLQEQLAQETGLKAESFIFASTHSHTAPDFIGGWGGVPSWYMQQVTDSLKTAAKEAVQNMQPAVLETGEALARQFTGERRDFYRSAEDDGISWFRLIAADKQPAPEVCDEPTPVAEEPTNEGNGNGFGNAGKATPAPTPTPVCTPAYPGEAIATVGAYAAHPVTEDESGGEGDADFPAVFAKRVEEKFGGTGMFLQTGLGNMSPRGNKVELGGGLADQIPPIGAGGVVSTPDVRVGRADWDQPVTNIPLGSLGVAGFFDRRFNQTPGAVHEGKGPDNKKCVSASPVSVDTSVSAAKIGSLWITGAPGEIFANYSNTIEERNPAGVTMALGLVNDGLGYIIQSFETDHAGRQGTGFVGTAETPEQFPEPISEYPVGAAEYEDAYSIDHCFGDAALEQTIRLLGSL